MAFLTELWLPILLSAVAVFVVSSVVHMVLPIHKGDYSKMSDEDAVLDALRSHQVGAGQYMFPCAESAKDMGTPEMQAKFEKGPVGYLTIMPPGGFNIGKSLVIWFVYSLLIGLLTAYVGFHALPAGADFMSVLRITGTAAIMAYAIGEIGNSIWKGVRWSTTAKFVFDGVLYGLATGAMFGWLWPDALIA